MDRIKRGILSNRQVLIFISLLGTVLMSQLASFLLRFEFVIPPVEVRHLGWGAVLAVVCKLSVLYWRRQHRGFLSFSGLGDLRRALEASLGASLAFVAVMLVVDPRYPRSIYILDLILTTGGDLRAGGGGADDPGVEAGGGERRARDPEHADLWSGRGGQGGGGRDRLEPEAGDEGGGIFG
jgi:hypothetical protein